MFNLPVKINGRRMQVLHLTDGETHQSEHINFLINKSDSKPLLFAIDSKAKMTSSICKAPIQLGALNNYAVESYTKGEGCSELVIWFCPIEYVRANKLTRVQNNREYQGPLMCNRGELRFNTNIDKNKHIKVTLKVPYRSNGEAKVYADSFTMFIYENKSDCREIRSAALDFGSDSSQVRLTDGSGKVCDANMPLVDAFEGVAKQSAQYDKGSEYLQGHSGDQLYKSVFYIRKNTGHKIEFAAKPQGCCENQFVQMLLKSNCNYWNDLLLLPNLKLIEVNAGTLLNSIKGATTPIQHLVDNAPVLYGSLSMPELRQNVLRVILGNFLHAILYNATDAKCLNMVLLVPNVYQQVKIKQLVDGLYKDFALIKQSGAYSCEAIEVQVISESDASFLGMRTRGIDLATLRTGENVLVIDGGKGTTDFSILQKTEGANYASLYRDGLPASGNVITYAFYEAFREYILKKTEIDIDNILFAPDAEYSLRVKALNYFEECKHRYKDELDNLANKADVDKKIDDKDKTEKPTKVVKKDELDNFDINKDGFASHFSSNDPKQALSSIFDALIMSDCYKIPEQKNKVTAKVQELATALSKSINTYMSGAKSKKFDQVLYMGRAFLFKPLLDRVTEELQINGWIDRNYTPHFDTDGSKTGCVKGALTVNNNLSINNNTGIIGAPILYERISGVGEKLCQTKLKNFVIKLCKFFGCVIINRDNDPHFYKMRVIDLNDTFYYNGCKYPADSVFIIGNNQYTFNLYAGLKEATVYYNGTDLICLQSPTNEGIIAPANNVSDDLLKQSLFPLNVIKVNTANLDKIKTLSNTKSTTTTTNKPITPPISGGNSGGNNNVWND